jgi:hypothetical protein
VGRCLTYIGESIGFVLCIRVAPRINKLVRGNGPRKTEGKRVGWWTAHRGKRRRVVGFVLCIRVAPRINKLVSGNGPRKREGKRVGWWAARRGKRRRVVGRVGWMVGLSPSKVTKSKTFYKTFCFLQI